MSLMLASVSDVFEAALAIDHGVGWIDIKDPRKGALGALQAAEIGAIVQHVRGRLPVSATIGDCWDTPEVVPGRVEHVAETGVDYIKVGLNLRKPKKHVSVLERCAARGHRLIVVCMAEYPPDEGAIRAIAAVGTAGIMLDTADKSGPGLTGLLEIGQILRAFRCRPSGGARSHEPIRFGSLGSLCGPQIPLRNLVGVVPLAAMRRQHPDRELPRRR